MAFDLKKIEDLIDKISTELIMLSADNLLEISDILGMTESLAEDFKAVDSTVANEIIEGIEGGLKSIICVEVEDVEKAISLIGDGLSLLQELSRCLAAARDFNADVPTWLENLARTKNKKGLLEKQCNDEDSGQHASVGECDAITFTAPQQLKQEKPQEFQDNFADFSASLGAALSINAFKREYLSAIEEIQVLLVATEQKSEPQAALSELSRNFRSILGAANLLNLEHLSLIAFNSISLIEYVIADNVPYSTLITDILLKSCDYMMNFVKGLNLDDRNHELAADPEIYNQAELEAFADELWMARQGVLPQKVEIKQAFISGAQQPSKPKKIGEILLEKGLISEGDLGGLIEAQQNARKLTLGEILVAEKYIESEDLQEALDEQKKHPERRLGEILVALGKLDYEQIDEAVKNQNEKRETKLGEFLVKSKIGAPEKVAIALREQKQSEGMFRAGSIAQQTVKVETSKLDGLIDLVGELVIAQSLISSNELVFSLGEQKISKDLAHVSRITSDLQRNAMSLRMVQIRPTFQKMHRLVRDLAQRFEKNVKFETFGDDTEIDRNMVESIYDPLVHLVRNSLDHGLEAPEARRLAGKSPQAYLSLKAYHQGGNVVIELSDDGRGLDLEKVRQKAFDMGLLDKDEEPTEAVLHSLIFHPGFSTAGVASDISGRGVGLDVVKKSIEKIRGKVEFTSVAGRGSSMRLRLPLTLAIIDGMIVRLGEHRYILPTISIVESFRPEAGDYFTIKGEGEMIKVRERLLPLVRLNHIVGDNGLARPDEALVIVVENEGESRCFLVDEVLGKQEVVIKSLGERLKHVQSLAGGTILGDGRVGLILDVNGLFSISGANLSDIRASYLASEVGEPDNDDWGMNEDDWAN